MTRLIPFCLYLRVESNRFWISIWKWFHRDLPLQKLLTYTLILRYNYIGHDSEHSEVSLRRLTLLAIGKPNRFWNTRSRQLYLVPSLSLGDNYVIPNAYVYKIIIIINNSLSNVMFYNLVENFSPNQLGSFICSFTYLITSKDLTSLIQQDSSAEMEWTYRQW